MLERRTPLAKKFVLLEYGLLAGVIIIIIIIIIIH